MDGNIGTVMPPREWTGKRIDPPKGWALKLVYFHHWLERINSSRNIQWGTGKVDLQHN